MVAGRFYHISQGPIGQGLPGAQPCATMAEAERNGPRDNPGAVQKWKKAACQAEGCRQLCAAGTKYCGKHNGSSNEGELLCHFSHVSFALANVGLLPSS